MNQRLDEIFAEAAGIADSAERAVFVERLAAEPPVAHPGRWRRSRALVLWAAIF